ncbi:CPBP family intramembrane glutamic endopeptidase [Christiangramia sediminis]|uniref:CPBP family intramembrane metalloprotease n=1 Tax=Christiangramia sediminis TaxID=2881336 RepID=A0A9X1RZC6_9FLAO|nr:type II CAAX endopeptidase family protein [Christiangramia sediminis]MCB7482135.1 CPBP family intramembrane metalloprotease [Christiangramia sediminis]
MSEQSKYQGWLRILFIIFPYIFIVGVFQLIGGVLTGFSYSNIEIEKTPAQRLIIQLFTFLGTILIVWLYLKYIDREKFIEIGLRFKNNMKSFWTGFAIGALIILSGFGILQILGEINIQNINFDFNQILISITIFVLVSLTEEILYRGYVLRNLMYSFNKYIALFISAVLFSLMHGFNPNIDIIGSTNIFLAGILLGITYIHTKNLLFPIALHFSWNFFQTILGFNVSGQNTYSVLKLSIPEKNILNGGAFGFEGSILSLVAILITIAAISMHYWKKTNHDRLHCK